MKYRVGVDVGGTFTDLVSIDEGGRVKVVKTSSTPADSSIGVKNAIVKAGMDLHDVSFLSHGATVGINTVIQTKGARTAIVTTKGFRDIIELRRGQRVIDKPTDMYNLQMDLPQDYVGGYSPIRYYLSFVNPKHEQRTKEILQEMLPDVYLSVSSEILPIIREYERLSTAVVNAYIMPIMQSYLLNLRSMLRARGFERDFYLMQSGGGIMSSELAGLRPVYTIDSGPAAGVTAATQLGTVLGFPDVISFDMGGTTAKVCAIHDGKPEITTDFWIDGKYFTGVSVMDMVEIGAGGGSMAWIDSAGAVHVGPQSAGADPGPV